MPRIVIVACVLTVLSGCTGESVSKGFDNIEGVKVWLEGPEAASANPGAVEPIPAAATASEVGIASSEAGNENTELLINGTDINNVGSGINETTSPTQNANPYVESALSHSEEFASIPDSETSQLTTAAEFLFLTARTVNLKVSLPSVAGIQASLSLCTDFEQSDSGYVVNYDSCPIRGAVIDGQFESDMALVNEFDKAIAVIWFPNQEFGPMYRTFQMADVPRDGGAYEWLWN